MEPVIFHVVPASSRMFWVILPVGGVLILVIALFVFIAHTARNTTAEVSDKGLRINGGMYGRFIPKESLVKEDIKVLNLNEDSAHRTTWRTNGVGLPGYSAGWFRLRNKEKALVYLTDRTRVVYIPTKEGYAVMLSLTQPEEMVKAAREVW